MSSLGEERCRKHFIISSVREQTENFKVLPIKVFDIEKSIVNKDEPVLYYLKDGPKQGFVIEELMIIPKETE